MAAEYYDKNGVPVQAGDLLKIYHFTGVRKKRYFMYKLVHLVQDRLQAVDCIELTLKGLDKAHKCLVSLIGDDFEVIDGADFEERPKKKLEAKQPEVEVEEKPIFSYVVEGINTAGSKRSVRVVRHLSTGSLIIMESPVLPIGEAENAVRQLLTAIQHNLVYAEAEVSDEDGPPDHYTHMLRIYSSLSPHNYHFYTYSVINAEGAHVLSGISQSANTAAIKQEYDEFADAVKSGQAKIAMF